MKTFANQMNAGYVWICDGYVIMHECRNVTDISLCMHAEIVHKIIPLEHKYTQATGITAFKNASRLCMWVCGRVGVCYVCACGCMCLSVRVYIYTFSAAARAVWQAVE